MAGCANGKCGAHSRRWAAPLDRTIIDGRRIEYVVRLPDGSYSDPIATIAEAFALAEQTGGQARTRAKAVT